MQPTHIFSNGCSFLSQRSRLGVYTHAGIELGKLLRLKEARHLGAGGRGNKRLSISTKVWCERYPEIADKCFFVIGITAGLRADFPVTESYKAHKFPELHSFWKTYKPWENKETEAFFKHLDNSANLDIEQMAHFEEMLKNVRDDMYKFRMHWGDFEKHGLILNNRSGVIDWVGIEESDVESLQGKPCHYPFYKMFVDWNGDVLFCSNDWGREHVVGNLLQQTLHEVWFSKPMNKIRQRLMRGDRSKSPCNKCSVDGSLFGKPSFDLIKDYYESPNNR